MPRRTRRAAVLALAAAVLLAVGACGKPVDLSKNLLVVDASTGWADAGLTENGENKLVPFVQFKLKNTSDQSLPVLQVNATFRPLKEDKEWGSRFQSVTGSEGLAAGATTPVITLRSDRGAKGTDPRATILKSAYFVDARVQLSAKYGSVQWARLAEYPVVRQFVN
jgi:hypothetical protein